MTLHITNPLNIQNEVFCYNLEKDMFSIGYFMVFYGMVIGRDVKKTLF